MYKKLKASIASLLVAAASVVLLSGFTVPTEKTNNTSAVHVDNLGRASAQAGLVVAQANSTVSSKNSAASDCMKSASLIAKTGNSVIDTRCSLVAFEVCMNKATGIISQSQGARKQCAIMQGLGGATACQLPCIAAAALPVGGSGIHGTYTGLTPFAVACHKDVMDKVGGVDEMADACNLNHALQCLMNGSSSPSVNAAILRQRKSECKSFHAAYPGGGCSACSNGDLRVDYDPSKIDLDSKFCNPILAAAKQCTMPVPGGAR